MNIQWTPLIILKECNIVYVVGWRLKLESLGATLISTQ